MLIMAGYRIRHRTVPMAVSMGLLVLYGSPWCIVYTLEIITSDFGLKVFGAKARFIRLAPLPLALLAVTVQYAALLRNHIRSKVTPQPSSAHGMSQSAGEMESLLRTGNLDTAGAYLPAVEAEFARLKDRPGELGWTTRNC